MGVATFWFEISTTARLPSRSGPPVGPSLRAKYSVANTQRARCEQATSGAPCKAQAQNALQFALQASSISCTRYLGKSNCTHADQHREQQQLRKILRREKQGGPVRSQLALHLCGLSDCRSPADSGEKSCSYIQKASSKVGMVAW